MGGAANGWSGGVQALANADFTLVAQVFSGAGFEARQPGHGVLQLVLPQPRSLRLRLLLSVGVHGDETAPIELLAQLLQALSSEPCKLAVDLMIVVGNPEAISRGTRFVDADLNRMFGSERGDLEQAAEARRADRIMQAVTPFFEDAPGSRWHLDLHSAIRPSRYPKFAVIPEPAGGRCKDLLGWMGAAGIDAAIFNRLPSSTFSAWTTHRFDAVSATLELGRVSVLGASDLGAFASTRAALDAFLRTGEAAAGLAPPVFRVAQELIKRSPAFRFCIDRDAVNFTALQPRTTIAIDGDSRYRVGPAEEFLVFPNPDVRPGLRAGLTVVRES